MLTYLKDDPTLSLLLQAEVLKIEKKFDQLSSVYEEMIKRRNTETLGYRGLMEQNLNQQDFHHAFIYGEKLFFLNPKIEKLYDTLIYIIAKTKNWNQLLLITEKAFSHKIIEKDIANENKSIAYYEIAKIKMMSDAKESIKLIHKALSLKKNFSPYIKLYLEILFLVPIKMFAYIFSKPDNKNSPEINILERDLNPQKKSASNSQYSLRY